MDPFRRLLTVATLTLAATVVLAQTAAAPRPAGPAPAAAAALLDINTATPEQLKALPGFGDAYAKRVIAGRPYTAKNQLVSRGVIPQAAYDAISGSIIAKHPAK